MSLQLLIHGIDAATRCLLACSMVWAWTACGVELDDAPDGGSVASSSAGSPAAADATDAGNLLGTGVSSDSGTTSSEPPLPPPRDLCAAFQVEYMPDVGVVDCATTVCPTIDCDCGAYSGSLCSPRYGCVQASDCSEVCVRNARWLMCVLDSCTSDADCGPAAGSGSCVRTAEADEGLCRDVAEGSCVGDENCVGGHCVVVDVDGTRQCVAADGSQHPCNDDSECGGETCFKPDDSFLGTCGNGFDRSSCHLDADCKPGFSCLAVPYADDGLGGCSEGRDGSLCGKDADCRVGRCIDYSCSPGTLRSPCHLDGDCDSGFCLFGAFCGDGTLGSGCEHDDDCSSNRCAGNAALSECTSGAPGSHCLDAADCESGVCIPEPGMDPYSTFGTCS